MCVAEPTSMLAASSITGRATRLATLAVRPAPRAFQTSCPLRTTGASMQTLGVSAAVTVGKPFACGSSWPTTSGSILSDGGEGAPRS
ncbi:hypothetical protein LEMLEM_LOCUS2747 [Lemmus lemmus]